MSDEWLNNPKLKNINKEKLAMLKQLTNQGTGKEQDKNAMMAFLMNAKKQSRQKGLRFNNEELNVMLEVMKEGKSKEEVAKMDKIINMMGMMKQR